MSFETANQRPARTTERPQQSERPQRRPYDSSEIDKLPQPTDSDPPYKPWWLDDDKKPS